MLSVRDYIAGALAAVLILGPMAAGAFRTGAERSGQGGGPSAADQPLTRGNTPVTSGRPSP